MRGPYRIARYRIGQTDTILPEGKSDVWAYENKDGSLDIHLDSFDRAGGYVAHIHFRTRRLVRRQRSEEAG